MSEILSTALTIGQNTPVLQEFTKNIMQTPDLRLTQLSDVDLEQLLSSTDTTPGDPTALQGPQGTSPGPHEQEPHEKKVFQDMDQPCDVLPHPHQQRTSLSPPGIVPGEWYGNSPTSCSLDGNFYDEPGLYDPGQSCGCPGNDLTTEQQGIQGLNANSQSWETSTITDTFQCVFTNSCSEGSAATSVGSGHLSNHHQYSQNCGENYTDNTYFSNDQHLPITIKPEPVDPELDGQPLVLGHMTRDEERKERRRAQNRRAAAKCRDKRRRHNELMQKDYDRMVRENKQRREEVVQLKRVVAELQTQLKLHSNKCGLDLKSSSSSSSSWQRITRET